MDAYNKWLDQDKSARFTMLRCMHNNLIREFEKYPTAKELWELLQVTYDSTSATRLRALTLKFNQYILDSKHFMIQHLDVMKDIIRDLQNARRFLQLEPPPTAGDPGLTAHSDGNKKSKSDLYAKKLKANTIPLELAARSAKKAFIHGMDSNVIATSAVVWMKQTWCFDGSPMRVLKWTSEFDPNEELPIMPIWIKVFGLRPHWFHHQLLYHIASLIGKPLELDDATTEIANPTVARICVEIKWRLNSKSNSGKSNSFSRCSMKGFLNIVHYVAIEYKLVFVSSPKGEKDLDTHNSHEQENPLIGQGSPNVVLETSKSCQDPKSLTMENNGVKDTRLVDINDQMFRILVQDTQLQNKDSSASYQERNGKYVEGLRMCKERALVASSSTEENDDDGRLQPDIAINLESIEERHR
ncbi:hypothetical protein BUALT_Bualt02G0093000 [Buddleja alternifolia]|uniref:DUF4283 domain-containing protein n=1 Tax=Buddleja alternifolia TaxID=168488 RepID=A0AAV6Y0X3_9LAMI|nr:hypothetical protein BUALT_Bualt02G0093000 [Buddleja alternifolia]